MHLVLADDNGRMWLDRDSIGDNIMRSRTEAGETLSQQTGNRSRLIAKDYASGEVGRHSRLGNESGRGVFDALQTVYAPQRVYVLVLGLRVYACTGAGSRPDQNIRVHDLTHARANVSE